jgi:transposase
MTAWRRLRKWQQAGVWERLHELLLAELHAADQLEWERGDR